MDRRDLLLTRLDDIGRSLAQTGTALALLDAHFQLNPAMRRAIVELLTPDTL